MVFGKSLKIRKKSNPLKEFMYGFALHGNVTYMLRTRMYMEHLFMLMTLGDMLGFPILPPYYSLRLLPYMVPNIKSWKMRTATGIGISLT